RTSRYPSSRVRTWTLARSPGRKRLSSLIQSWTEGSSDRTVGAAESACAPARAKERRRAEIMAPPSEERVRPETSSGARSYVHNKRERIQRTPCHQFTCLRYNHLRLNVGSNCPLLATVCRFPVLHSIDASTSSSRR